MEGEVVNKMKDIVYRYDPAAKIIFFGSRARGDWHLESDWDFLILSSLDENSHVKDHIRKDILNEIELITFDTVNTLWHNKDVWQNQYSVTNIYKSISAEGIEV
jgi:predicted nucleotidyltransferase